MKYPLFFGLIISTWCFLLSNAANVFAQPEQILTIKSYGTGLSEQAALNNALKNAVRTVAGEMVITERKVINDDLMDKMTSYSDGVVRTYQQLDASRDSQGIYRVLVLATVDKSRITRYLQQSIVGGRVDGPGLYGYMMTAQEKQLQRKKLVEDYRLKLLQVGYEVKLGRITLPSDGSPTLGVYFQVTIKKDFIENFQAIFERAGVVGKGERYSGCGGILIPCGDVTFKILDPISMEQFRSYEELPKVLISLIDSQGRAISRTCVSLPENSNTSSFVEVEYDYIKHENESITFFPRGRYLDDLPPEDRLVLINVDPQSLSRVKNISAKIACN